MTPRLYKGQSLWAFPTDYTVVDIETTGMSPEACAIIEVSALRYRDDKLVDTFDTLVNPGCHIDWFSTRLTGIDDRMVYNAPTIDEVMPDFARFVGEDILMGHNVNFDINFLYDNLWRTTGQYLMNDFVDVLRLSRKALPQLPSHKQTALAEYFGIDSLGAHRAGRDCEICQANYLRLKQILQDNH